MVVGSGVVGASVVGSGFVGASVVGSGVVGSNVACSGAAKLFSQSSTIKVEKISLIYIFDT